VTVYISGPLASPTLLGRARNVLLAHKWAWLWRGNDATVICPHEEAGWRYILHGETADEREDALRRCLARIDQLDDLAGDFVFMLRGWERSAGACVEHEEALACGVGVAYEEGAVVTLRPRHEVSR
jgi:Domain of unknown function (DUF4406)